MKSKKVSRLLKKKKKKKGKGSSPCWCDSIIWLRPRDWITLSATRTRLFRQQSQVAGGVGLLQDFLLVHHSYLVLHIRYIIKANITQNFEISNI